MASITASCALGSGSSTFGAQAFLEKRAVGFSPASVQLRTGVPCSVEHNRRLPLRPSALPAAGREEANVLPREPERTEPTEKSLDVMRKFSEQYARRSGTFFCVDKGVTSVVIKGLAEHKDSLGAPLCPCRHYDDKPAEVEQGFWNCPCVPMRERKECHCMLFLTSDNDFAGEDQKITLEEIRESTANF